MGANTPLGRQEKHGDASRKSQVPSSSSLKRPGSPNLSEASGNESSRKKIKKQHGSRLGMSPHGTPRGSRAASPAMGPSAGGSRAASPPNNTGGLPTREEVLSKIPDGGITIKNLIGIFQTRSMSKEMQTAFIKLVKELAATNKETGLLMRRK
jgi:transcription initiation factor TFIIF subunit alpha